MILLYRGLGKEKIIIMEQDLIKPGQSGQDRDLFLLLNKQKAMFLAWPFVVGFTLANQKTNYSIGAPATLVNLMTPLSSTKKIRVPVVPLTAGLARHVYWFTFTNA